MPESVVAGMRGTPHWPALVSAAATLAYDEWHAVPPAVLAPVLAEFLR